MASIRRRLLNHLQETGLYFSSHGRCGPAQETLRCDVHVPIVSTDHNGQRGIQALRPKVIKFCRVSFDLRRTVSAIFESSSLGILSIDRDIADNALALVVENAGVDRVTQLACAVVNRGTDSLGQSSGKSADADKKFVMQQLRELVEAQRDLAVTLDHDGEVIRHLAHHWDAIGGKQRFNFWRKGILLSRHRADPKTPVAKVWL